MFNNVNEERKIVPTILSNKDTLLNILDYSVFMSGAMTSIDDYASKFKEVENKLKLLGFTKIFNPATSEYIHNEDDSYATIITRDICILDKCQIIFLMDGFKESNGSKMEYSYAIDNNKIIMSFNKNGDLSIVYTNLHSGEFDFNSPFNSGRSSYKLYNVKIDWSSIEEAKVEPNTNDVYDKYPRSSVSLEDFIDLYSNDEAPSRVHIFTAHTDHIYTLPELCSDRDVMIRKVRYFKIKNNMLCIWI